MFILTISPDGKSKMPSHTNRLDVNLPCLYVDRGVHTVLVRERAHSEGNVLSIYYI